MSKDWALFKKDSSAKMSWYSFPNPQFNDFYKIFDSPHLRLLNQVFKQSISNDPSKSRNPKLLKEEQRKSDNNEETQL
jgi:hypothetical protein